MIIAASIAAIAAGALHVFIFVLESILWDSDFTRTTFSIADPEESRATRSMAFNQGFYNLFLALMAIAGAILALTGGTDTGVALIVAGTASMSAAAVVLLVSDPTKRTAALKQLPLPLLTLILLLVAALF
jgi:putative membrane protein